MGAFGKRSVETWGVPRYEKEEAEGGRR